MSDFKGTPGPWSLSEGWIDNHLSIDAERHGAIALVLSSMEKDHTFSEIEWASKQSELSANSKLIAAAPELLEALQWMKMALNSGTAMDIAIGQEKSDAAIAKALGQ